MVLLQKYEYHLYQKAHKIVKVYYTKLVDKYIFYPTCPLFEMLFGS